MRNRHRIAMSLLGAAYMVAAVGSLYPAYTAFVGLSALPPGTRIRPMGLAMLIVAFAVAGFLLASLLSVLAIAAEKNKKTIWLGLGAVLLSVLSLPISSITTNYVIEMNGLIDAG